MRVHFLAAVLSAVPASAFADEAATARPDPPVLKETTTEFPKGGSVEYRVMTATIQPGTFSAWHTHPAPVAVYVEKGTFTLERKGTGSISILEGEALLEPIDVEVRAANHGSVPATVIIFQVSSPQEPFLTPTKQ